MAIPVFFQSIRAKLLLIPLIGFCFVKQMEQLLWEGQRQVLVSAAQLPSVTLSDRPQLFAEQPLENAAAQAERRKLLALFGSADPETTAQISAAYLPPDEIEIILGVVAKTAI